MKNSLLLPPFFVLIFSLVFIFLTIINVLYQIITNLADAQILSAALIYNTALASMIAVLPGAVLLTLIFLFFRMLKKPGNRFLSYLLITIAGVLILAGGMKLLLVLKPAEVRDERKIAAYVKQACFQPAGESIFYIDKISGNTLTDTLFADISEETNGQRLFHYSVGSVKLTDSGAEVLLEERVRRRITIDNKTIQQNAAEFDFLTNELLSAYTLVSGEIKRLASADQFSFYVFCLGFVFLFVTTNLFMRITRWPLFNFFFLVFIIGGIFFLYSLFTTFIVKELGALIKTGTLPAFLPVVSMFVLGGLFFFFDIVFIPFKLKEREIAVE